MSATDDPKDELAGTEAPFVSHLVELRDRLIRALHRGGRLFGVLCVWPGPGGLYDLLAAPLVGQPAAGRHADRDQRDLAVPGAAEDHADGGVPGRAAGRAVPGVGLRRAGPVLAREEAGAAAGGLEHAAVLRSAWRSATSSCSAGRSPFIQSFAPKSDHRGAGHRAVLRLRADDVPRVRRRVRGAGRRSSCWRASAWSASSS